MPMSPPWLPPPAEPFEHHAWVDGELISANVYVLPIPSGPFRPFVFVEGIDFGLSGGLPPLRNGDFGWREFWGCDAVGYPMMADMPILIDSLVHRGFTPVLIDFEDGNTDLFDNAELLIDILLHLQEHRTDDRPMVISGASMGGQIARIALRLMELRGEPTCTGLYVSLDSPHQGANVPLGLQQLLHFLNQNGSETLQALVQALHSPAARQLLVRQVPSLTPRIAYQDSLNQLGLPSSCRTASIANGSSSPLTSDGAFLLEYDHSLIESGWFGNVGDLVRLHVYSFPGSEDHPDALPGWGVTADVHIPSDADWPWPLNQGTAHASLSDQNELGPLDRLPGGTRPSMLQFASAFNEHINDLDLPWPVCLPPIESSQMVPLQSFIPTLSALDIPPPWSANLNVPDVLANSPFDAVHIATLNEAHSEINEANLAFLLHQLDVSECPLLPGTVIQDTVLLAQDGWRLPPLVVAGRLALHSADTSLSPLVADPLSHGEFTMDGCAGTFTVQPNGILELGGPGFPGPGATARVHLADGTHLLVKGKLIIHEGSELVVDAGGELNLRHAEVDIREGGQLTLMLGSRLFLEGVNQWIQGPSSVANMDGLCELGPDAEWQGQFSSGMQLRTQHEFNVLCAPGSKADFHSTMDPALWILAPSGHVTISGQGKWIWNEVGIRMSGQGHFSLSSSQNQHWSSTWSGTSSDSLTIHGHAFLTDHDVHHIQFVHTEGTLYAESSQFMHGQAHSDGRLNLHHCDFHDNPLLHSSISTAPPHLIRECRFEDGTVGVVSNANAPLRLRECVFDHLDIAVSVQSTRCEVICSAFRNNDIAISANRSLLAMTPSEGGGWSQFEDNDVHLDFNEAPIPLWIHGANHFGNWWSAWAQGSLDVPCQGPISIDATGQSWSWPSNWPQIQSSLWSSSNGTETCPIHVVDLNPVDQPDCGLGKKPKKE